MKSLVLTFAIVLSSFSAHAISGSYYTQVLNSEIYKALEADATERGFYLSSIADSGDRFRCACADLILTFKNQSGEAITKKVQSSFSGAKADRVKLVQE